MIDLLFPTLVSLLCMAMGLRLIKAPKQINSPSKSLLNLISDGLRTHSKRLSISLIQVIIYLTISLYGLSILFNTYFSWAQIAAFTLGCSLMSTSSIACQLRIPRLIGDLLNDCEPYFAPGLTRLYKISSGISFTIVGTLILGLIACRAAAPISIIGYGVGCIFSAFFLRIGGGMFKSAADIASDLIVQVPKDIPHTDQRNAATILDITGDFIGEVLGFSSDIVSSFIFAIIGCSLFALGTSYSLFNLPLLIVSVAALVAIIVYTFSIIRLKTTSHNFLLEGLYIGIIICGILTYIVLNTNPLFKLINVSDNLIALTAFGPYMLGLVGAICIGFTAEYLTSTHYKPTQKIARESEFGASISLLNALGNGLKSNSLYLIYILAIVGFSIAIAGFYGVALAALGMLSMSISIITINLFTPLAANVHKIAKLSERNPIIVANTKQMDQIGHTAAALGNGFSTGTSLISTAGVFFALLWITKTNFQASILTNPLFFIGLVIGALIPFIISGTLLHGLTQSIIRLIQEVKRQFKQIPYLTEKKADPDIIKAADLVSRITVAKLTIPGLCMGFIPILAGYALGIEFLLGILVGASLICLSQGYYWSNTGDALNNAKNYIQSGRFGGKESQNFQHISIADNIGDAFKDLLGPSTNICIKCLSIVSILVLLFLTQKG